MSSTTYLALDIGAKRIGVAVGSVVPFGRGAIDGQDTHAALETIREVIEREGVQEIVVGVPRVRSGDVTESQRLALEWVELLKQTFSLPIETVDESYTSQEAENQLRREKVDTKTEKWRVDERSAELILAQYLNSRLHAKPS